MIESRPQRSDADALRESCHDEPLDDGSDPWDAFLPDDDYEPAPEPGDFWPELDAA